MNGWHAFRRGLSLVIRYPQPWLLLFVANLLAALVLAAVPALLLASGPALRPSIRDVADGVDTWLVLETIMSPLAGQVLAGEPAPASQAGGPVSLLLVLLLLAGIPLAAWLPAAFFEGGLLLTFHEGGPFRWRRFWWGCWHWWGAFLLLAAVQGTATLLLLAPLVAIVGGGALVGGSWLAWLGLALLALLLVPILALLEYTRVMAVATATRNPFRAFGRGIGFVVHRLPAVAGLYALSLAGVALLHALFRLGLLPAIPLDWWPLVLVLQQSFVLLRIGTRLARLGGATALVEV